MVIRKLKGCEKTSRCLNVSFITSRTFVHWHILISRKQSGTGYMLNNKCRVRRWIMSHFSLDGEWFSFCFWKSCLKVHCLCQQWTTLVNFFFFFFLKKWKGYLIPIPRGENTLSYLISFSVESCKNCVCACMCVCVYSYTHQDTKQGQ